MAERPDLEAIEQRLSYTTNSFVGTHEEAAEFLQSLLTCCRELEAENKRLQESMDAWIKKWTFEGGIYDDAPQPPKA